MKETTKSFKSVLIDTFKAFDEFCKENDIRYFAAYGTLIGTVRHQGLIPWDDDIDVWMLPNDYEKFCSCRDAVKGHYAIMDSREKNYWLLSLVKFVDTNTTIWESEHFPCITGVYIDVFKLDECDPQAALSLREEYDKVSYSLTYAMMKHSCHEIFSLLINGHSKKAFKYIIDSLYYRPFYKKFRRAYESCRMKIEESTGDYLVSYDGLYREKEIFKKEWFSSTIRMTFEELEINAPVGYHEILSQLYGNYMQLPPIDKQVSHHYFYYLDLCHRWTISDIKKMHKKY